MCVPSRTWFLVIQLLLQLENIFAPNFRIIPEHIFTLDVVLICQPAHERLDLNALVSIWEYDKITNDDFLGKVSVSRDKHFQYLFKHEEFGEVVPYLVIYHDCNPNVVYGKCYAQTRFQFSEPSEMGATVYLQIDLLDQPTKIICDKGYPFNHSPPLIVSPHQTLNATKNPSVTNATVAKLMQHLNWTAAMSLNGRSTGERISDDFA